MKKSIFIILLISCCIFILSRFISFTPPSLHITMQPIPENSEATERHSESIYQVFTRRSQDKECGCRADICEPETHKCIEWEKRYFNGQLESYTIYETKQIPKSPAKNFLFIKLSFLRFSLNLILLCTFLCIRIY